MRRMGWKQVPWLSDIFTSGCFETASTLSHLQEKWHHSELQTLQLFAVPTSVSSETGPRNLLEPSSPRSWTLDLSSNGAFKVRQSHAAGCQRLGCSLAAPLPPQEGPCCRAACQRGPTVNLYQYVPVGSLNVKQLSPFVRVCVCVYASVADDGSE